MSGISDLRDQVGTVYPTGVRGINIYTKACAKCQDPFPTTNPQQTICHKCQRQIHVDAMHIGREIGARAAENVKRKLGLSDR